MDTYIMNGFDDMFEPMNGTSDVMPMNGTSAVIPMNGTSDVMPMNGTSAVIPMQGDGGGTYYVSPLALLDEQDVPMQGLPEDYDSEDVAAYRLGYMVGDADAMQGLFSKFKEKRAAKKAEKDAAKSEKQALRMEGKRLRLQRKKEGKTFLDKALEVGGGFLKNVGEAKRLEAEAAAGLDDEGIDFDPEIVAQRAMLSADAGAKSSGGGGIMDWWNSLGTPAKLGVGLAAGALAFAGYKLLTKKKGRK